MDCGEECKMQEVEREFRTEFIFKTRTEMALFLKNIYNWNEREKREKATRELRQKIKKFQTNLNIRTFKEAKILYLEQMQKIENVINL
jgi:hypothetical protein